MSAEQVGRACHPASMPPGSRPVGHHNGVGGVRRLDGLASAQVRREVADELRARYKREALEACRRAREEGKLEGLELGCKEGLAQGAASLRSAVAKIKDEARRQVDQEREAHRAELARRAQACEALERQLAEARQREGDLRREVDRAAAERAKWESSAREARIEGTAAAERERELRQRVDEARRVRRGVSGSLAPRTAGLAAAAPRVCITDTLSISQPGGASLSGLVEKESLVKRTLEAVFALVARLGEPASEPRLGQAHVSALRSGLRDLLPRIVAAATAEGHSSAAASSARQTPREPRPDPTPAGPARAPDLTAAPTPLSPPRPRRESGQAPAPGAPPEAARTRPDGAVEVTFAGGMGLRLTTVQAGRRPGAEVANMVALPSGQPSPAAQCGLLAVGDRVVEVDGKPVEQLAYAEVVQALRAASKPFRVAFRRPAPLPPPQAVRTTSAPAPLAHATAAARCGPLPSRPARGPFVPARPCASWALSMGQYTTVVDAKHQFVGFAVCSTLAPEAAAAGSGSGSLREAVWEIGQGLDADPAWPTAVAASQCAVTAVKRAAPSPLLPPAVVWRRYSDFEWLRGRLAKRFPWVVLPRVPAKVRARLATSSHPSFLTHTHTHTLLAPSATRRRRPPPTSTTPTSSHAGAPACCCGCAGWRATRCCAPPRR